MKKGLKKALITKKKMIFYIFVFFFGKNEWLQKTREKSAKKNTN